MTVHPGRSRFAWTTHRLVDSCRLIEAIAFGFATAAIAGLTLPIVLVLFQRPDRDHPVSRLLEACQEGARRGSLAVVGVGAAVVVATFGLSVVLQVLWRGGRDLRAMWRFNRHVDSTAVRYRSPPGAGSGVAVVPGRTAFTAGLVRRRVYVGADLLVLLGPAELEAVLLHEGHHRRNFDPLRCWLVGLVLSSVPWRAGRAMSSHYRAAREADADGAAVRAQRDDRPLLRALALAESLDNRAGACGLTAERQLALRRVRQLESPLGGRQWLPMVLGLSVVFGLLALTAIGLSDWQWYWFCPSGDPMPG